MNLTLIKVNNPFIHTDRDVTVIDYRPQRTLLNIRNDYIPIGVDVISSVNGRIIPIHQLDLCQPQPNDCIVFVPIVHGGDDGVKSVLRIAAMIGLMTVIPAGSPVWMKAMIMFGGSMLISALIPPPKPELPSLDTSLQSQATAWNPETKQEPGTPIPKFYGISRVYGNIISAHRENEGTTSISNVLIGLGVGPVRKLSDFMINDQPATSFQGVSVFEKRGLLNDTPTVPFESVKLEYSMWVKIEEGSFSYTTSGQDFDGLEVELTWPQGLYRFSSKGALVVNQCHVGIDIRKVGTTSWRALLWSLIDDQYIYITESRWSIGIWGITVKSRDSPFGFKRISHWREIIIPTDATNKYAYSDGQYFGNWQEEGGAGYELRYRWLPVGEKIYTSISQVQNYRMFSEATPTRLTHTERVSSLEAGRYEIRVSQYTTLQSPEAEDLYLSCVREVRDDSFIYPRLAHVGIKALATDQLSGSLRFSCIQEGAYIRAYTGTSWDYVVSSNPAWVCFDILTQPVIEAVESSSLLIGYDYYDSDAKLSLRVARENGVERYDGINPSRMDVIKFGEWADWCDELVTNGKGGTEKRITFNGGFDSVTTMWDAAMQVCQIGRATLVYNGITITVAVDKPSVPVQLFGVGDIYADTFKETFIPMADRASELQISYVNKDNGYTREVFTVFDPTVGKTNSVSIQLFGITTESEAWRAGMYRLYNNRYLTRAVEFDADVDAIACTVGDVINVQHDVPQWGFGGRIVSATENSISLDRSVVVEVGKTYGVVIRLSNDTIVSKSVTNMPGEYTTLTVSTPFSSVPVLYDLYAFGETSKIVKPVRVVSLTRSQDLRRTITAIEYNASVYNCDTEEPALPTTNYSALETLPSVTGIILDELLILGPDGGVEDVIDVFFSPPQVSYYWYAEIWHHNGVKWIHVGDTSTNYFRIRNVSVGVEYTVAVVTINQLGDRMKIQNAPQAQISTLGKLDPPSDVTGFTAVQNKQFVNFSWPHIPDADLWGYEIRQGSAWEGGRVVASGISADQYSWQAELNGTYRLLIKAIDRSGIYSVTAASVDITLKEIDENINVIILQDEITKPGGPDGIKTNFVFVDSTPDYMTMPHMLLDTDASSLTDTSPDITGYAGDTTLSAEYVTNAIDTLKVGATWTRILDTFDAFDRGATDLSYPDRTDTSYPSDTDTHITMPTTKKIYVQYSSNGSDWSAWSEYLGTVQNEFRYAKMKYAVTVSSTTGVFRLLNLLLKFDVPDVELTIESFSVSAGTGNDVSFSTYSQQFYTVPVITATLIGGTVNKVPVISNKSDTGFHIDLRDKTDAAVAGTVDLRISGY